MLPERRPRLMAERIEVSVREARMAEEQRRQELAARKTAEAAQRDRARRAWANTPAAQALQTAAGWVLSILGALVVSLALTWLVRHPSALEAFASMMRSTFHWR